MTDYEVRMLSKLVNERKCVAAYSGCWLKGCFKKTDKFFFFFKVCIENMIRLE